MKKTFFLHSKYIDMIGIQSLQSGNASDHQNIKWNAHDTTIMCLDYNPTKRCFISGSEDCYYRVWDEFGRLLYSSQMLNYPISQIKWASHGQYFVVGSNNLLLFCDYRGWVYNYVNLDEENVGSILCVDWTGDSNQLSFGSSQGNVAFGIIVDKQMSYNNYIVELNKSNQIIIRDVSMENTDNNNIYELIDDITDNILHFTIDFDYLILITTKKCYIYHLSNVSTPNIYALGNSGHANRSGSCVIHLIYQTPTFFILTSNSKGIQVIDYNGNLITEIRSPSLKSQLISNENLSANNEMIAVVDSLSCNKIHFFDASTGKAVYKYYSHSSDVINVAIPKAQVFHSNQNMQLAFIDNNKDLFLLKLITNDATNNDKHIPYKLCTVKFNLHVYVMCTCDNCHADKSIILISKLI